MMYSLILATTLNIHPFDLVRVEDPNFPNADAVSETGAVLLEPPPPGTKWTFEAVAHTDGWVAKEAFEAMNITPWHEAGATGSGVKIAVFDVAWFGSHTYPEELGPVSTHDCYNDPTCNLPLDTEARFSFETGIHGYACAEVIHDLAPDAELYLVRTNGFTAFENAVNWAIGERIDLISMSLSFFNNSFYDGTGPFGPLVDKLAAHNILLVTSAGNYAEGHWKGQYHDGDQDGRMDFDGANGLYVHLGSGDNKRIYLNWNQHYTCGQSDLDLFVFDSATKGDRTIVGSSADLQDAEGDHCQPVERTSMTITRDDWYWLEVHHKAGSMSFVDVDIHVRDGSLHEPIRQGSITEPAVHSRAFAVAAVRADGYLHNNVEGFSSWGAFGSFKPDIAGPDGLSTAAYGAVGFYGTSASTPAVTGLIAVVMSDDRTLSPREAANRVQAWALNDEPLFSHPDTRWGAGKARLPLREPREVGCGRRPLIMPLFLVPLGFLRRRGGTFKGRPGIT
ncbi:MAG: S8 family serine peptidase [Proteobacteria bacterium]|nr:S8 family serine peptidase [Pseudomonadota bacterium]